MVKFLVHYFASKRCSPPIDGFSLSAHTQCAFLAACRLRNICSLLLVGLHVLATPNACHSSREYDGRAEIVYFETNKRRARVKETCSFLSLFIDSF
ncbi:hypothetical protein AAHA92_31508 [Salvia divinorum]|uniref:Secreted protein n=1 Tax=Salvia divinorum TaxID=28513 RepID=A0ABD1FQL6_SALDI